MKTLDSPSCPGCGSEIVFYSTHRKAWLLDTENGYAEPEAAYCPACGKKLPSSPPFDG